MNEPVFIPSDRLGVLQATVSALLSAPTKRARQRAFKDMEHTLVLLKLLPKAYGAASMGVVVRADGAIGLEISNTQPLRIEAPVLPTGE